MLASSRRAECSAQVQQVHLMSFAHKLKKFAFKQLTTTLSNYLITCSNSRSVSMTFHTQQVSKEQILHISSTTARLSDALDCWLIGALDIITAYQINHICILMLWSLPQLHYLSWLIILFLSKQSAVACSTTTLELGCKDHGAADPRASETAI